MRIPPPDSARTRALGAPPSPDGDDDDDDGAGGGGDAGAGKGAARRPDTLASLEPYARLFAHRHAPRAHHTGP